MTDMKNQAISETQRAEIVVLIEQVRKDNPEMGPIWCVVKARQLWDAEQLAKQVKP